MAMWVFGHFYVHVGSNVDLVGTGAVVTGANWDRIDGPGWEIG